MTSILNTDSYRAASDTADIKVQRYIDFGFGPRVIWRIVLKRDGDQLANVLEERRLMPPSKRTVKRIRAQY